MRTFNAINWHLRIESFPSNLKTNFILQVDFNYLV